MVSLLIGLITKMKRLISDEAKLSQKPTKSRETNLISYLPNLKRDGIIHDAIFPSAEKNSNSLLCHSLTQYDSKALGGSWHQTSQT